MPHRRSGRAGDRGPVAHRQSANSGGYGRIFTKSLLAGRPSADPGTSIESRPVDAGCERGCRGLTMRVCALVWSAGDVGAQVLEFRILGPVQVIRGGREV